MADTIQTNDQEIALAVENYLTSSRMKDGLSHVHKDKKFYISDMGKCYRTRWLKRHGIGSEFASHVNWVFAIGDMYHGYVYKALEAQGKLIEAEETVSTDHFSGRFDGIVQETSCKSVLDIKSISGYPLEQILKGGEKEEYIRQLLTYLMILRDQGRTDLERALLLFVNKEPSDKLPVMFVERHFYLTKPREQDLRNEMKTMEDYWVNHKVPPCTCPVWMKAYNSYLPLCQATEQQIIGLLPKLHDYNIITTKTGLFIENKDGTDRKDLVL